MSNPKTYKWCIVPKCVSTTVSSPEKLFFLVPYEVEMRKKWMRAIKRDNPPSNKSCVYCCEDHFDIEKDMENYIKFKLVGGKIQLKKGVVPHKFQCQKNTEEKAETSAVDKRNEDLRDIKEDSGPLTPEAPEEIFVMFEEDNIKEEPLRLENDPFMDKSKLHHHKAIQFYHNSNLLETASTEPDEVFGQCRCCLKKDYHKDFTESDYKDVFRDCFNLSLSTNSKLTNLICTECVSQIDDAVQFKETVVQSEQQLLREISDNEAYGCNDLDIKSETDAVKVELEVCTGKDDHAGDYDDQPAVNEPDACSVKDQADSDDDEPETNASGDSDYQPDDDDDEPDTEAEDSNVDNQPDNNIGPLQYVQRLLNRNETSEDQIMENIAAGINASSSSNTKDTKNLAIERSKKENLMYLEENEKEMLTEVQIQHNDSKCKLYSCSICKYTANIEKLINTHLQAHSSANKYICDSCSFIATNKRILITHIRTHLLDLYLCNICNKKFATRYTLKRHVMIHTGKKPYACKICDKKFTQNWDLQYHIKTHLTDPLKCTGKKFSQRSNLQNHVRKHTGEKPFACMICDKKFSNKSTHYHHKIIHEKPHVCNVCNKRFAKASVLNCHFRIHTDEKPYACKICYKKYRLKCSFDYHMKIHSGDRPYVCNICGKTCVQSCESKSHEKVHTGEKPYVCEKCGKKFPTNVGLKRHVNKRKKSCD